MESYFNQNFSVRNCNVPCCHGQHFIKFRDGKAVIPVWELFQTEKCWKRNIKNLCGIVCENDNLCNFHRKLNVFEFFTQYIRARNINRNDVVSKIFIRDNCRHPYCLNSWCFKICETTWVLSDKTLQYRAIKYLQLFFLFLF